MKRVSAIVCVGALSVMATCLAMSSESSDPSVEAYLKAHPTLRMATLADCGKCDDDIKEIRESESLVWPAIPDYYPYRLVADFNGDRKSDLAVVLMDTTAKKKPFLVVVFNSIVQGAPSGAAFELRNLDLRNGGLFFGPPRPKPYRLLIGAFGTDGGILLEPKGKTYRIAPPSAEED